MSGEELGLPQQLQASIVPSALALVMVGKLMFTSLFARCAPPEGDLAPKTEGSLLAPCSQPGWVAELVRRGV